MVAQLFNTNHGLKFDTEKKQADLIDLSLLNIDDAGDSRYDTIVRLCCFVLAHILIACIWVQLAIRPCCVAHFIC